MYGLKKSIREQIKKNQNLWAIYVLMRMIKNKDKQSIDLFLTMENRADYIKIQRNGEENYGKIIYVINEMSPRYGFFAEFRSTLSGLYYAKKMGFIPYVNWGKNFTYYEERGVNGNFNAFEYYFESINSNIDISKCSAVTYCNLAQVHEVSVIDNSEGYIVSEKLEGILADMLKNYVRIKRELLEEFEGQAIRFFMGKDTLGIHYRGTDFKCGYDQHPVAIKKEQMIEKAKELIEKYDIEVIFLATDDLNALEEFKEVFGDKLRFFEDVYRGTENVNIAFSEAERDKHRYYLGREVLRDVYMLSKCDYLISGLSQVSLAARMFKRSRDEKYKENITIDNGINKGANVFKVTNH